MLPLVEARGRILETIAPLGPESIPVAAAEGRILGEDILAPRALPAFDTSAVDGYAVRSEDVRNASVETPVFLPLTAQIAAGHPAAAFLSPNTCQRIYTGAMAPPGADAVIMQEDTAPDRTGGALIGITSSAKPLENIRLRGEDIRSGATVVVRGTRLAFGHIALLSALGISLVKAGQRPVATLLASGSELCEPGQPLGPGQIYESNRAALDCLIRKCGGLTRIEPLIGDHLDTLSDAMRDALEKSDVLVTIGGVSVGDFDLVRPAFARLGGEILFWKVDVRPGKPFVYGRWRGKLLFGLPGNPVSAAVCCWLLVRPALLALQGAAGSESAAIPAILGESLRNRADRPHFFRVCRGPEGRLYSAGAQGAHILSSLAGSQGLLEVPPRQTLAAGAEVSFLPWD